MTLDLFTHADEQAAIRARDAVLERVGDSAVTFMERGLDAISRLPRGEKLIGEEIRAKLIAQDIEPHDPHVWGRLTQAALKQGLIRETGVWRKMMSKKANGRRSPEYLVLMRPHG